MSINPYPALRTNPFFTIQITHIPTGKKVNFEGWVTQFSDTYTTNWNTTPVYGRMDPLATYQGTGRSIQLGFDIINDSAEIARFNIANIGQLMKFLYPVYESAEPSMQNVLKAAPVLSMKWTNLISNANGEELVGYINGPVSYSPDMGEGGFTTREVSEWASDEKYREARMNTPRAEEVDVEKYKLGNYIPKKVNLSFNFSVIHTHLGGWAPPPGSQPLTPAQLKAGKTQTFVFGGSKTIEASFPNIVSAPPAPAGQADARAEIDSEAWEQEILRRNPQIPPGSEGEVAYDQRRDAERALANAPEGAADAGQVVNSNSNLTPTTGETDALGNPRAGGR